MPGQDSKISINQTWSRPDGFSSRDMPESALGLPPEMGRVGFIEQTSRSEFALFTYQAQLAVPITFQAEMQTAGPYFFISSVLSGGGAFRHNRLSGETKAGSTSIGLLRDPHTELCHHLGERLSSVDFILSAQGLLDNLQGQRLPASIERFIGGRLDPMVATMRTTPRMHSIAGQVQRNPYQGTMATLYGEGKAYEFLAEALSTLPDGDGAADLPSSARRRALDARDIMVANLTTPPLIADVARLLGVSQRQLDHMFKDVFGASPLQCLTRWRLEEARALLARGDLSVKQVSYMMGYAHVSSFSHAYGRQFGETPSALTRP